MIIAAQIRAPGKAAGLVKEMYKSRAQVFHQEKGWDVHVNAAGEERDEYDELPGVYLLSVDENWNLQGSVRLLPTMGNYMAAREFQQVLGDTAPPRHFDTWETSRIHPVPNVENPKLVFAELLCAIGMFGETAGYSKIISIIETKVGAFFKRIMALPYQTIGHPIQFGVCKTEAGMFEATQAAILPVAKKMGIDLPTIIDPSQMPDQIPVPMVASARG